MSGVSSFVLRAKHVNWFGAARTRLDGDLHLTHAQSDFCYSSYKYRAYTLIKPGVWTFSSSPHTMALLASETVPAEK